MRQNYFFLSIINLGHSFIILGQNWLQLRWKISLGHKKEDFFFSSAKKWEMRWSNKWLVIKSWLGYVEKKRRNSGGGFFCDSIFIKKCCSNWTRGVGGSWIQHFCSFDPGIFFYQATGTSGSHVTWVSMQFQNKWELKVEPNFCQNSRGIATNIFTMQLCDNLTKPTCWEFKSIWEGFDFSCVSCLVWVLT